MSNAKRVKIDDIRRDLASPDVETRGHAIHVLLVSIYRQPELQAPAREIFRHAIEHETYPWLVTNSVIGLEKVDGPDAARPHWRRLLTQPDVSQAATVAMSVSHPSHLPMMLDLLSARPDYWFRRSVVCSLGRMKDPSVIPLLLKLGEEKALTQYVVQALGDIGDPSAIPWLQTIVPSDEHLPELDERGATWTLGDIAAQAIRSIEYRSGKRAPIHPTPTPAGTLHTTPPPLPGSWANVVPAGAWRPWSLVHPAFVPLAAAGLELVWLFCLFALYIFMVGDQKPTFTVNDRLIDAIALPLPIIGLVAAITVTLGGLAPRAWQKAAVLAGGLICAYFTFAFGYNFMTR